MAATAESVQGNIRTARKAAIKRASKRGRAELRKLDGDARRALRSAYDQARASIEQAIISAGDSGAVLRIEVLQELLGQVNQRIAILSSERNQLLDEALGAAAQLGVRPFAEDAAALGVGLTQVANESAQFVRTFLAEDGLQLSDRLWRLDRGAREAVGRAIESAVIQGHGASRAAADFLARGEAVPADVAAKIGEAGAEKVAKAAGQALMRDDESAYANALRVFRTEINRAHGEAYQAAAFEHPEVIGTRFLLSPNHPRPDICDMHASVNRYGLGPGVYPKDRNPWPAHPNTLSFVVVVFQDEVTDADRQGKEDRIEWLKKQGPGMQEAVLGSTRKRAALAKGILTENEIRTPWKVLKQKYIRKGVDVDKLTPPPAVVPPKEVTKSNSPAFWRAAFDDSDEIVTKAVQAQPPPKMFPRESGSGAYHMQGGIMMGEGYRPGTAEAGRVWRHEYGHYVDWQLRKPGRLYRSAKRDGWSELDQDAQVWDKRRKDAYRRMKASEGLRDEFARRRYSLRAYKDARAAAASASQQELLAMARQRSQRSGARYFGRPPSDIVPEIVDELFADDDSIFAEVWRLLDEQDRRFFASKLHAAARFEDFGFIGDHHIRHPSGVNMADLVGSITGNKTGWGHTNGYYSARAEHGQPAEAFANVFDLLSYGEDGFEARILELFAPRFAAFVRRVLS